MNSKKYVKMWAEENYNNYDLSSIVENYGYKAAFGLSAREAVVYAKNFYAEFYLKKDELNSLAINGYDFYIKNNGLDKLIIKSKREINETDRLMKELIGTDLNKLKTEELFQKYVYYIRSFGDLIRSYIVTQPIYISKIESELKKELKNFDNTDELFDILTSSKNNFVFSKKGNFLQKSFAELISGEDSDIDKSLLDEPLYKMGHDKDILRRKKEIENSLSKKALLLGDILAKIGELRFKLRLAWMPVLYFFELIIIEIKLRSGVPKNIIKKYDVDEFENLILFNKKVDNKILKERSTGFVKILKNGEIKTLTGKEASDFISKLRNVSNNKVSKIKGSVASKGIARGKVIVFSYTDSFSHAEKIKNMKDGDILVSEMTRPNIIAACKKAGAIITDEGGITCHAAIVSREMKKPCIIGTKIATQVLNDGDLVEVDANEGLIKIIKKAKK